MGVPSAARWLLSWLPESSEPSLEEWSASNLYLIPPKPQKQHDAAAVAQQQRFASKWPPPRPGRLMHGLPHGSPASPYGRFGKSFPPMLEAPQERREEEELEQDESMHRGLKRAHSSSGVIAEPPKRRSLEQRERQELGQQPWQQPGQQAGGGGDGVRRSTDPGGHMWRATQPIAICPGGARPQPSRLPHAKGHQHCNPGGRPSVSSSRQQQASTADHAWPIDMENGENADLSQLLDDTVQLLGQSSLLARQESAPAIMVRHSCAATVRALNASLSSSSLAAQAAATCMDSDRDAGTPEQRSPAQRDEQDSAFAML